MAWADLTDCRAYYELIGEGEPLLLIPGLGATCRLWDPIVPELARHFTLVMLDNRGMGLSKGLCGKAPPFFLFRGSALPVGGGTRSPPSWPATSLWSCSTTAAWASPR